jgi:hypothetical protein
MTENGGYVVHAQDEQKVIAGLSVLARLARESSLGVCRVTADAPAPRITQTLFFIVDRRVSDS